MTKTLHSTVEAYRAANSSYMQSDYIGCGGDGLITFYKAIGVEVPVVDDMSENLIVTYGNYVRKHLHPAMAELCLLDFKAFLEFTYQRGFTMQDYSQLVKPDTLKAAANDFSAYESQKWKS